MPLWHCNNCHHEWEGSDTSRACDWCHGSGRIIAEKTPLEQMLARDPKKVPKR